MSRLQIIRHRVYRLLTIDRNARADDFILNWLYWSRECGIDWNEPIGEVMTRHAERGLPAWDSISRARRKLQQDYSELRADKETEARRLAEQKKYIEFAMED